MTRRPTENDYPEATENTQMDVSNSQHDPHTIEEGIRVSAGPIPKKTDSLKKIKAPEPEQLEKERRLRWCLCLVLGMLVILLVGVVIVLVAVWWNSSQQQQARAVPATTAVYASNDEAYAALYYSLPVETRNAITLSPTTPQFQAAQWVQTDPNLRAWVEDDGSTGLGRLQQRYALAVFYFAMSNGNPNAFPAVTQAQQAAGKVNWLTYANAQGTPASECDWIGVGECDVTTNRLLVLGSTDLKGCTGTVPPEIVLVSTLQRMELSQVLDLTQMSMRYRMDEFVPLFIMIQMPALTSLDVSHNGLIGTLPATVFNVTQLQAVNAKGNLLTGSALPTEIGTMTALTSLDLSENDALQGTIPSELGMLSQLQDLDVLAYHYGALRLTGSVPTEVGRMTAMRSFKLDTTNLEPAVIHANFPQLESWKAFLTLFTPSLYDGTLPTALGQFANAVYLHKVFKLAETAFYQVQIPSEIGKMSSLEELDVEVTISTSSTSTTTSNNAIIMGGSLPTHLSGLSHLRRLSLNGGVIEGVLPTELGLLSQLTHLEIVDNPRLQGSIPSELETISDLTLLNLSDNQLTGRVPTELGELNNLVRLWLHNNPRMQGPVPVEVCDLVQLRSRGDYALTASWCPTWTACCRV